MRCVIVAGGKGTRLGLTGIPKPMVPIRGIPLLEYQVRMVRQHGCTDILVLAGHLADVIIEHFGDGSRLGVRFEYLIEPTPLGTGGALLHARDRLQEDFLVLYGDVFFDMNLSALFAFHRSRGAMGTLVVHPNSHPHDSDLVEVAEDGTIAAFHPKPHRAGEDLPNLVNAALYVLTREIFDHIPRSAPSDLGKDVFPSVVAGGGRLCAYPTPEYIKDIGTRDRLAAVERDVGAGKPARRNLGTSQRCVFLDRDGVVNREAGGILRPDQLALEHGAVEALRALNRSDYLAIVVTNQPFIAKGQMTAGDLRSVHARMDTLLGREGVYLDALYYCPHHPERGWEGEVAELKMGCDCRKPNPGMLRRAARDFHIDLSRSYIIGDRLVDAQAGRNAGLAASILVGAGAAEGVRGRDYDASFSSPVEAVEAILGGRV